MDEYCPGVDLRRDRFIDHARFLGVLSLLLHGRNSSQFGYRVVRVEMAKD